MVPSPLVRGLDTEVVVAGAGPTGLVTACELARRGVHVRVVDRSPTDHARSNATELQPRTLAVLYNLGVLDEVMAKGIRRRNVEVIVRGHRAARVRLPGDDGRYCAALGVDPGELERTLAKALTRFGVTVERGVHVRAIDQQRQRVELHAMRAGKPAHIRARWLVGCDGSRSVVRAAVGIHFEGRELEEKFFVADVVAEHGCPSPDTTLWCAGRGLLVALPLPAPRSFRLFGDVDGAPDAGFAPERLRGLVSERSGRTLRVREVLRSSALSITSRLAGAYRSQRVLLAGDAAHTHSPLGGHGLNLGVQDAANLAWKLALVCQGVAKDDLIESYEAERRPVAARVIGQTALHTVLATSRLALLHDGIALTASLAQLLPSPGQPHPLTPGERYAYRDSPIVLGRASPFALRHRRTVVPGAWVTDLPLAHGDGITLHSLLRGTAHTALLFAGARPSVRDYDSLGRTASALVARLGALVRVFFVVAGPQRPTRASLSASSVRDPASEVHAHFGMSDHTCGGVVLIRPDGFVGYAGRDAHERNVDAYIERLSLGGPRLAANERAATHA